MMIRCSFCRELERILTRYPIGPERQAAEKELWDRYGRASRARRQYARRKGYICPYCGAMVLAGVEHLDYTDPRDKIRRAQ